MNKDNAKDYLPLVQALAEGKTIQQRTWTDVNQWEWRDADEVDLFRYNPSDYRIKPEPREIWVVVGPFDDNFTREGAESLAEKYPGSVVSRYREVIE